ncbi:MAG: ABC-F type ribosomal protection protein [Bacillota bacterium]|jgi:macrolide transport system ATP-binding/permease protein|nr:ABC-F type ribosomal protection protein [Bacillota bacterium]NLV63493.1 ABC-F type ribosomal protection protein [Clostridiaceae bacterium]
MLLIEAQNIKKYYHDRKIIEFDDFKVYSGDKIGIVGQNGSGKTTFLNILSGEVETDEGYVRRFCDITYIRQFSDEEIEADQKEISRMNLSQIADQAVCSGGELTRIKIANAFSKNNLLVFADEPTSNLDFRGVEILKERLSQVDSMLLISHNRDLLDSLCNKTLEIRDGKIKIYNGNYSFYKEQRGIEQKNEMVEYEKYVSEKTKLTNAIENRQRRSGKMRKAPKRMGNSEARLHTRQANEKQEKIHNAVNSLRTRLEKLEVKESPKELPMIQLDFSLTNPPANRIVISAENFSFSYGKKKIFQNTGFRIFNGSKTALLGENGVGKTTLLNLIAGSGNGSIKIVPKARIGYFYQGFENLQQNMTVLDNVMAESVQSQTVARTILARLLITGDDVYKKVEVLSGGEKIKVSFAKLFVSSANVFLLDEPTNYLDMSSIEALENMLSCYEGTVLFVSHDRAFVNRVADRLLLIENQSISEFDGNLDKLEKYKKQQIQKDINDPEQIALQMRMTEIIAKLSRQDANKDELEAEYGRLLKKLRERRTV